MSKIYRVVTVAAMLVLCIANPAHAQYDSIAVGDSCSYFGESMPRNVTSFRSDAEAENVIARILDHSGLRPNFKIHAAGVPNAAAVVRYGKRYILYNQQFMRTMRRHTGTKWAAISIMAHEIGHHLQGHTLKDGGSRPSIELEADEYSGAMVHKLGGSLEEALVAIKLLGNDYGSRTHPAKRDRLAAISSGYIRSEELSGGSRGGSQDRTAPSRNRDTASRGSTAGDDAYMRRCEAEGVDSKLDSYSVDGTGKALNGKKCGEWTFDYGLQQVYVLTYKDDKKHGPAIQTGQFEKFVEEGQYKNDKREGWWIITFSSYSADLVEEGEYRRGKKHGRWEETAKTSGGHVSQKIQVYRHGILVETIEQ